MTGTIAIVQARMGSTRLPGKVLLDLEGEPVLARVLARLARARSLDGVVVATSDTPRDDPLVSWCEMQGVRVHRGSEHDVLSRFASAAQAERADHVVRVTSDCPLVDPDLVDQVVDALLRQGADYAANVLPPRTFPRGLDVEAFTTQALLEADRQDEDPASREHVTTYLRQHPATFQHTAVQHGTDLSAHRWTVDTPEDLELARVVYRHFGHDRFSWLDVVAAFEEHPHWWQINGHIRQKGIG